MGRLFSLSWLKRIITLWSLRSNGEKHDPEKALRKKIIEHLKDREGVRYVVYLDTLGYPTGGVGHLITSADKLSVGDPISPEQVDAWLEKDMEKALAGARKNAKEIGIETDDFIIALTSVNFQLGTGWPTKFYKTYPNLVKGQWRKAIVGLRGSRWAKQTPVRVEDFVKAIEKAFTKNK